MTKKQFPKHIGFIPDGNRRWAQEKGMSKERGYEFGISPGITLLRHCKELGIEEISIYGFTQENTHRPNIQKQAFSKACVEFAMNAIKENTALQVLGNDLSDQFPESLRPYIKRQGSGIKVNLLTNYGWQWDLEGIKNGGLKSREIPRLDLIVRWGGGRRLSGFLPVQSVYADFYVIDDYWPDYRYKHLKDALSWFSKQDHTLGG